MGVGTIVAGILIAFLIIVVVIGIIAYVVGSAVVKNMENITQESKPVKYETIKITPTYDSIDCYWNDLLDKTICH